MCWRSWNTFLDLMTVLYPLSINQLGLGLHHYHGEGVGADLHVLDVMELSANSLGDIVTIIIVFDNNSTCDRFFITVSLECRNTNIFIEFNIVQLTFVVVHNFDNSWTMRFYYMLNLAMYSIMLLAWIALWIGRLGSRSILLGGTMILTMYLMMSLRKLMMHKRCHLLTINSNYWQDVDYENLKSRRLKSLLYVSIPTRGGNMVASREELNNNSEGRLTFSIYTPTQTSTVLLLHCCSPDITIRTIS